MDLKNFNSTPLHKKCWNIFRIQVNTSITCGYFCNGFIYLFMLAGKTLIDYTSLFSPHEFEKNDNLILSSKWMNVIPLKQLIYTQI